MNTSYLVTNINWSNFKYNSYDTYYINNFLNFSLKKQTNIFLLKIWHKIAKYIYNKKLTAVTFII
jgi:hypothetical protein